MKYGVIYLKYIPEDTNHSWIKYCQIYGALPLDLQDGIKMVVNSTNNVYNGDMVVPMGYHAQLGCIVKAESVNKIAKSIYGMYCVMLNDIGLSPDVRVVYSIGKIKNTNVESIHQLAPDEILVKVGRYLDKSNDIGIFKI